MIFFIDDDYGLLSSKRWVDRADAEKSSVFCV